MAANVGGTGRSGHQGPSLIRVPDPIVGRAPELARVDAALDALGRGEPACLAVEGEPGIGKTRLLAELRRRAEDRGHVVLAGAAAEFERDLPYGVWVEALDAYVASRQLTDAELVADLAVALPSLGATAGAGDGRHRLHRAIRKLVTLLAEREPLVLVLDDLHWSDPASVDLLSSLVRRGLPPGALLALGYRTGRAPRGLAATLTAAPATVLELSALSEEHCGALSGDRLAPARRAAIFRESGGNPFYALSLAGADETPARSSSSDRMATDSGVPRAVAAALSEELATLTPGARRLLDAGSIAGDPFEPELAFAIAELDAGAGMAALDELLELRLLAPTTVPRRFAFRHPLVRRAVYESVGGGWRMSAHGRAAAALAARGAAPVTRARHVEQSAVAGEEAAIELLLDAATATAPRAPAAAARWFEAALRLQAEEDSAGRLQTLVGLAQVLRSTGDLEACAERFTEALEHADDAGTRVRLIAAAAVAQHFLGRHEAADQQLDAAYAALGDRESEDALTVLFAQIAGAFFSLDVERGCQVSAQALAVAQRLGDPLLIGSSAAGLAHACANAGDAGGAADAVTLAVEHLDAADDQALARFIDALNRLAWSEYLIERDDDAVRHAARGIAIARATAQDQFMPMLAGAQALSLLRQGHVVAALALQADALETAKVAANDYVTCWVLSTTAHIAIARGDGEDARRDAELAVALVEGLEGRIPVMARARLAVIQRILGDHPQGTGELMDALPPSWAAPYAEALARTEIADGSRDAARPFVERVERAAARLDLPWATALAERSRAELLLADGDARGAAKLALASAAGAHSGPITRARSQAIAGRALASTGERTEAIALLRAAEQTFAANGIEHDRDRARRELRKLKARTEPRGPTAPGDSGVASLSTREREIAGLVTDRHTNREIAAALFLSEKTVESHLRNIFAKLGASSRVEVARTVEREIRERP